MALGVPWAPRPRSTGTCSTFSASPVSPVHSIEEIELLHGRFPQHIRLFEAAFDSELLAGVVIFESAMVAHVQYIAASERGRDALGARGDIERYCGAPIGTIDGQAAGPLALDGEPRTEPQWRL